MTTLTTLAYVAVAHVVAVAACYVVLAGQVTLLDRVAGVLARRRRRRARQLRPARPAAPVVAYTPGHVRVRGHDGVRLDTTMLDQTVVLAAVAPADRAAGWPIWRPASEYLARLS